MRPDVWTTYYIGGYAQNVTGDYASAGGVVLYQIRRVRGEWQRRRVQSNGRHWSAETPETIDPAEGESLYREAVEEEKRLNEARARIR